MKLELTVSSMVCDGCVDVVKKAIMDKSPKAEVVINLESKKVSIETDYSTEEIKQAIEGAGHTVI